MTSSLFILAPVGSSGDVHPFIGVGRALRARGHDVVLVAGEPFRDVAERAGLRAVVTHTTAEFEHLSRDPDLWHPRKGLRLVLRAAAEGMRREHEVIGSVYEPGRSVLVRHALSFGARVFEETRGAPSATLQLAPAIFRSVHSPPAPWPGGDLTRVPRCLKRAMWWLIDRLAIDPHVTPALNAFRRELGLRPIARPFRAWIHSPRRVIGLFPDWFAPPQRDWPPQLQLTGFPLYDEAEQHPVPADVEGFLAAGDPPLLFTPGSANRAAAAFFSAAVDATTRLNRRALLVSRYQEQVPLLLPATIRHERYLPFSRVLSRCAAIVHHGGIGTSAQGLAAGIPQLTMPLGFDQPDNTTRLWRLGVGRWVSPSRFHGPAVARTLDALLADGLTASACRHWSETVRPARSLDQTCTLLEELAK